MKVLIMAGGSGERFWPLSTKSNPKQLLNLVSDKSMIRDTVDRILNLVDYDDIFIATNKVQVDGIRQHIPELREENIIIEPIFRDTAAAIAYGSTYIANYEENPIIIVLASDHLIIKTGAFVHAIQQASIEAIKGSIVTLGIKPTRPETGYGYIKLDHMKLNHISQARRFLEKPNYETAIDYIDDGSYVWNSGMFVFQYDTIMSELEKYVPNHVAIIKEMTPIMRVESGLELSVKVSTLFSKFEKISIDYAVMEKSNIIKCIPVDIGWSDVGGYNSLAELFEKDSNKNTVKNARYVYVDSNENIIISEDTERLVTTIGVSNMIIVDASTGVLVCNRDDAQRIKELLKLIPDIK